MGVLKETTRDVQVNILMTWEERELLREASRETGVPQSVFLRDGGLEAAERRLWRHRQRRSAAVS